MFLRCSYRLTGLCFFFEIREYVLSASQSLYLKNSLSITTSRNVCGKYMCMMAPVFSCDGWWGFCGKPWLITWSNDLAGWIEPACFLALQCPVVTSFSNHIKTWLEWEELIVCFPPLLDSCPQPKWNNIWAEWWLLWCSIWT